MRCFFLSFFLVTLALGSVAQTQLLGDTPLATTPPNFTALNHSAPPGGLWADDTAPLPTNAWWQNLALGGGGFTVNTLPYMVQAHADGLRFGMPGKVVDPNYIFTTYTENLSFRAVSYTHLTLPTKA